MSREKRHDGFDPYAAPVMPWEADPDVPRAAPQPSMTGDAESKVLLVDRKGQPLLTAQPRAVGYDPRRAR